MLLVFNVSGPIVIQIIFIKFNSCPMSLIIVCKHFVVTYLLFCVGVRCRCLLSVTVVANVTHVKSIENGAHFVLYNACCTEWNNGTGDGSKVHKFRQQSTAFLWLSVFGNNKITLSVRTGLAEYFKCSTRNSAGDKIPERDVFLFTTI